MSVEVTQSISQQDMVDSSSEGVKVLEKTTILPASESVPPTSTIRLTNFDLMCYTFPPVDRIFFYSLPSCSQSAFLNTHVPNLKHSLSLTLLRFFPLAGRLIPTDPANPSSDPILSYTEGDGVDFTVAVCHRDFDDLIGHHPRQATKFAGLVPKLSTAGVVAIQLTLFPHSGIGVGVCYHHGSADGSSNMHFLKTWAAFSQDRIASDDVDDSQLPCFSRNMFPEPPELAGTVKDLKAGIEDYQRRKDGGSIKLFDLTTDSSSVRATFVVTKAQLDNLRVKILSQASSPPTIYLSSFTLVSAIVWRCMVSSNNKHRREEEEEEEEEEEFESFNFLSNFRSQPTSMFPSNYFGNCLIPGRVKMRRKELLGEDGLVKVPVAINEAIQIMKTKPIFCCFSGVSMIFSMAGSPKLGVYGLDFGWGRPRKVEVISIGKGCCMSLAENRDEEEGGFEIGVFLSVHQFKHFKQLFLALVC